MPATAEAPAATAATAAPAATGAESPKGIFDSIALPATDPAATETAAAGADGAGTGKETGKAAEGATGAEPAESETDTEAGGGETAKAAAVIKLFAGRFKKVEDLEVAYNQSSQEGFRLFQRERELTEKLQAQADRVAELEDKVKNPVPVFKELDEKAVAELKATDPGAYADYMVDLKLHRRDAEAAQAKNKVQREEARQRGQKIVTYQKQRVEHMMANPEIFPDFDALRPVMSEIMDKTGENLKGQEWTPDVLYFAAMGLKTLRALAKGKASTKEAAGKAKTTADAGAAAAAGTAAAGSRGSPKGSGGPQSDDDVMKGILAAAPKALFAS